MQTGLDVGGLVPGVGEPLDLINAGISTLRGDYTGAALSAAGAIPFVGWGATAAKLRRRAALLNRALGNIQQFNVSKIFDDPNKVRHLFHPKHNLDRLGTNQQALDKITKSVFEADKSGLIPQSGPFNLTRNIDGHAVRINGAVVNGELRYGTFWIP